MNDLRVGIRESVLSGRVDDAKQLLNTHFPSVLTAEPSAHAQAQASIDDVWAFYKKVMPWLMSQDYVQGIFPFGN